ncbi:MAG: hypothetical protein IKB16_06920 [Lentisphaeria bacterium]|nr:hypothetical protein [Lentisphaeria bacterium]
MKAGQLFDCPHCGNNTFLMKEAVMDGWTKKCDILKCSSCGTVIEEIKDDTTKNTDTAKDKQNEKRNALAALFGEEPEDYKATNTDLFNTEKRFCRDCQYRVMNAFRIRCGKHEKDVNPMDDCPDFKPRTEQA